MTKTSLTARPPVWEMFGIAPTSPSLQGTGLSFAGHHSAYVGTSAPDAARLSAQDSARDRPV